MIATIEDLIKNWQCDKCGSNMISRVVQKDNGRKRCYCRCRLSGIDYVPGKGGYRFELERIEE